MSIIAIVAMDPAGVIAVDGKIPWHYKSDMRRFKRLTMGKTLVVGRKTWQTLPILKGREVVVLTRDAENLVGGAHIPLCSTCGDSMWPYIRGLAEDHTVYIAGGAEIYRLAMEAGVVDTIDVTMVPTVSVPVGGTVTRFPMDLLESLFSRAAEWVEDDGLRRCWYGRRG